ncbi:MAG: PfkB family carbohydrate kinase [Streptosporangiaceae bacterium]
MTGRAADPPGSLVTGRLFSRLLHLGNVVIDVVLDIPALPERGGDVLASRTELTPGGGFNVLAAAARLGLPASYAGGHGTGPLGDLARARLAGEGIGVLQPRKAGLDTGFVISMVDATGERTFVTSPGAEAELTPADLAHVPAGGTDAVYLSGYSLVHPANRAALLGWLARLGSDPTLFFDPGPLVRSIPAEALAAAAHRADWVTLNAREAALLTGQPDPAPALRALTRSPPWTPRPGQGVLVRTGPKGCMLAHFETPGTVVPGFRVTVADSNGAGDTHTGAFIAMLAAGEDEVEAARRANAAAALSVTRRGPATAPNGSELARFLYSQSWNSSFRN